MWGTERVTLSIASHCSANFCIDSIIVILAKRGIR